MFSPRGWASIVFLTIALLFTLILAEPCFSQFFVETRLQSIHEGFDDGASAKKQATATSTPASPPAPSSAPSSASSPSSPPPPTAAAASSGSGKSPVQVSSTTLQGTSVPPATLPNVGQKNAEIVKTQGNAAASSRVDNAAVAATAATTDTGVKQLPKPSPAEIRKIVGDSALFQGLQKTPAA